MNNKTSNKIKKIWEFLKHPITSLIVGVALTIIFYNLGLKNIEPRYSVSEPELIAEQTLDAPNLKLLWNDKEIEDISSVKVAVWNSGQQYLDNAAISDTDPIRILIPKGINILYSEFIKTSRNSLRFKTSMELFKGDQVILIEIDGDEALEYKDGGIIKILYTGKPDTDFIVQGRIKGNKDGFVKTDWRKTDLFIFFGGIINIILMIFVILKAPRTMLYRIRSNEWKNKSFATDLFMTIIAIVSLIFMFVLVFNNVVALYQPNWLK